MLREQTGNGQQGEQDQERETTEEEPPGESEETAAAAVGGKEKESPPEEAVEGDVEENALPGRDKDGSNASPGYLSDEDIAHLGAPSGDDVDPTMAAIFKVRQREVRRLTGREFYSFVKLLENDVIYIFFCRFQLGYWGMSSREPIRRGARLMKYESNGKAKKR